MPEASNKCFISNRFWVDLDTLEKHKMGKYENYYVGAFYNDKYILKRDNKFAALSEIELLELDKED